MIDEIHFTAIRLRMDINSVPNGAIRLRMEIVKSVPDADAGTAWVECASAERSSITNAKRKLAFKTLSKNLPSLLRK